MSGTLGVMLLILSMVMGWGGGALTKEGDKEGACAALLAQIICMVAGVYLWNL